MDRGTRGGRIRRTHFQGRAIVPWVRRFDTEQTSKRAHHLVGYKSSVAEGLYAMLDKEGRRKARRAARPFGWLKEKK